MLDLAEQDILGLRVTQQIIQFDRRFGSLDHDLKLFVRLLNTVECSVIINVLYSLVVKLVVESVKMVPKVQFGALIHSASR